MKKLTLTILTGILLATLVLGGCSSSNTSIDGPGKIVVAGQYKEGVEQYKTYYEISHEGKEVEVVSFQSDDPEQEREDSYTAVKKLLEGENAPDVLFLDIDTLSRLADDGYLQPIDTLAKNKKYDLDSFIPSIMDYVKKKGNGTLYGIPLSFYSNALFYNKDMFDAAGIPYPTDDMSWDEVYDLARNFSEGEGLDSTYGLHLGYSYEQFVFLQAAQRGVTFMNDDMKTVSLNTPEWRSIFEEGRKTIEEGIAAPTFNWEEAMKQGIEPGPFADNPFLGGKAAMAILSSYDVNYLDEQFQWAGEEAKPFNWDIVTIPRQADTPGYGGMMGISDIVVINKNASNLDLAWDFVSYITGDELTKILSKSNYATPTRMKYVQKEGKNINYEALYKLEPVDSYFPIPEEFMRKYDAWWGVLDPLSSNLTPIMEGKTDLDKGLEETHNKMQEALDRIIEEHEKKAEEEGSTQPGS